MSARPSVRPADVECERPELSQHPEHVGFTPMLDDAAAFEPEDVNHRDRELLARCFDAHERTDVSSPLRARITTRSPDSIRSSILTS